MLNKVEHRYPIFATALISGRNEIERRVGTASTLMRVNGHHVYGFVLDGGLWRHSVSSTVKRDFVEAKLRPGGQMAFYVTPRHQWAVLQQPEPRQTALARKQHDYARRRCQERRGYVERQPDVESARGIPAHHAPRRALYEAINRGLIAQQAELLAGLDAQVRASISDVIRRLAKAAEARFVSDLSVGSCAPACGTGNCD